MLTEADGHLQVERRCARAIRILRGGGLLVWAGMDADRLPPHRLGLAFRRAPAFHFPEGGLTAFLQRAGGRAGAARKGEERLRLRASGARSEIKGMVRLQAVKHRRERALLRRRPPRGRPAAVKFPRQFGEEPRPVARGCYRP